MPRGESNTYDFYETPKRATHTQKDNTANRYNFTADAFGTPQAVNDKAAENIEININTTNKNKLGVEKQVSPTPKKGQFIF